MANKKELLTKKELKVQKLFLKRISIKKHKTKRPIVVAMVGLVGSGKSSIAKELANLIGANIIRGDEIRIFLRKEKEQYKNTSKIGANIAIEILGRRGSVILDSDFIDSKKRTVIAKIARKFRARLVFIRTYADFDAMIGRVITAHYRGESDDFFKGASSKWKGADKGAVVKIREMARRLPYHYRWEDKIGGRWVLKKLPLNIFGEIDTAGSGWKTEVKKIAQKLLK